MIIAFSIAAVALLAVGAAVTAVAVRRLENAHPPAGRFVAAGCGRLHVVELGPRGAAPPIVLLHGASGNLEDQRLTLGALLARDRRVILIDRPGHGFSTRPGGAALASPGRQAALIAEALDILGVGRAVIVGHSWSGALAAAFALDFPDRVAALVLLAPVTHPWRGGIAWYNRVLTTPVIGPLFARTVALPAGLLMMEAAARATFAPEQMPDRYLDRAALRLLLRPAEFIANAQDIAGLKAFVAAQSARYRDIAAPTAVIAGDRDTTVSPDVHARAFAAQVAQAELTVLPGVGHMPHHTQADFIVAAIDRLNARADARVSRR